MNRYIKFVEISSGLIRNFRIPRYLSKFSKKIYIQHQLLILIILKDYLYPKTILFSNDLRGIIMHMLQKYILFIKSSDLSGVRHGPLLYRTSTFCFLLHSTGASNHHIIVPIGEGFLKRYRVKSNG